MNISTLRSIVLMIIGPRRPAATKVQRRTSGIDDGVWTPLLSAYREKEKFHERDAMPSGEIMTNSADAAFLRSLGWSDFFASQIEPHEIGLAPKRIAEVHRARLSAISDAGPVKLSLATYANTADFAVGDWVL